MPIRFGSRARLFVVMLAVVIVKFGGAFAEAKTMGADHSAPNLLPIPANATSAGLSRAESLGEAGYVEEEFFAAGVARTIRATEPLTPDGLWRTAFDLDGAYATRFLVRRPADPADFNGTVIVEWLNVSAGTDSDPLYILASAEFLRRGYAYVGVSAQSIGVDALQRSNLDRYGALSHPGDAWSYDIYRQIGLTLRAGGSNGILPLGPLTDRVRRVMAAGESQSAGRLYSYYNAVAPLDDVYDGYFISSFGQPVLVSEPLRAAAPPNLPEPPTIRAPRQTFLRDDLSAPVMFVNTESEAPLLGAARGIHLQPDNPKLRLWEITGAAHADTFLTGGFIDCGDPPINSGPHRFVARAGFRALTKWVAFGVAPRSAPRHVVTSEGGQAALRRDPDTGIAVGGVRLPQVTVPVSTLTGVRPQDEDSFFFCFLFGATDPWNGDTDPWDGDPELDPSPIREPRLDERYESFFNYRIGYYLATLAAARQGYLLRADIIEVLEESRAEPF